MTTLHSMPSSATTQPPPRLLSGFSQVWRFLRASAKAEACSLWRDSDAIAAYAFDDPRAGHPSAIRSGREKPFHHQEAFIRFRPLSVSGGLGGTNSLPEGTLRTAG